MRYLCDFIGRSVVSHELKLSGDIRGIWNNFSAGTFVRQCCTGFAKACAKLESNFPANLAYAVRGVNLRAAATVVLNTWTKFSLGDTPCHCQYGPGLDFSQLAYLIIARFSQLKWRVFIVGHGSTFTENRVGRVSLLHNELAALR